MVCQVSPSHQKPYKIFIWLPCSYIIFYRKLPFQKFRMSLRSVTVHHYFRTPESVLLMSFLAHIFMHLPCYMSEIKEVLSWFDVQWYKVHTSFIKIGYLVQKLSWRCTSHSTVILQACLFF